MDYVSMIKDCGLKATPQRICILKILANHKHPTMDELYEQIRKNYSTVSLATVYKNISMLIDKGIVVEVNAPNQKVKFDIFSIIICISYAKNAAQYAMWILTANFWINFRKPLIVKSAISQSGLMS